MNSWEIIKSKVRGTPGSAGYQAWLCQAAELFVEIAPKLKDRAKSEWIFAIDNEVREALANRCHLTECWLLK